MSTSGAPGATQERSLVERALQCGPPDAARRIPPAALELRYSTWYRSGVVPLTYDVKNPAAVS